MLSQGKSLPVCISLSSKLQSDDSDKALVENSNQLRFKDEQLSSGSFGEDAVNVNEEVLREFATFNELKITNTFFRNKNIHIYSWSARELRFVPVVLRTGD